MLFKINKIIIFTFCVGFSVHTYAAGQPCGSGQDCCEASTIKGVDGIIPYIPPSLLRPLPQSPPSPVCDFSQVCLVAHRLSFATVPLSRSRGRCVPFDVLDEGEDGRCDLACGAETGCAFEHGVTVKDDKGISFSMDLVSCRGKAPTSDCKYSSPVSTPTLSPNPENSIDGFYCKAGYKCFRKLNNSGDPEATGKCKRANSFINKASLCGAICGAGKDCFDKGVSSEESTADRNRNQIAGEPLDSSYNQVQCIEEEKKQCWNYGEGSPDSDNHSVSLYTCPTPSGPPQINNPLQNLIPPLRLSSSDIKYLQGMPFNVDAITLLSGRQVTGYPFIRSVYSVGRADQPDYICKKLGDLNKWYPQLFCHTQGSKPECVEGGDCKCTTKIDGTTEQEGTVCKFARIDPFRNERSRRSKRYRPTTGGASSKARISLEQSELSSRILIINTHSY